MASTHVMLAAVILCATHLVASYDFTKLLPVTARCKRTIHSCVGPKADFTNTVTPGQQCALFNIMINGVDSYHCSVLLGLCTSAEFFKLKEYACKVASPKQTPPSGETLKLYEVIENKGQTCSGTIVECIKSSSVVTMFKQLERYCDMLGVTFDHFSFKTCVLESDECLSEDFDDFLKAACGGNNRSTTPHQLTAFLDSDNLRCRQTFDKCTANNAKAKGLIQSKRYCDALEIIAAGKTPFQCSAAPGGCTKKEADDLKSAFCPGETKTKTIKATNLGARAYGHVMILLSHVVLFSLRYIL